MKKQNWKNIIDPCFNEMVKNYLSGIQLLRKLPNEGLFQISEDLNKTILSNNNLNSPFSLDDEQFIKTFVTDDLSNLILNADEQIENDSTKYINELLKIANRLPEKSKQFYIKEIEAMSNESDFIPIEGLTEKEKEIAINKYTKHFTSIVCSLFARSHFLNLDDIIKNEYGNNEDELFNDPVFCNGLMMSINYFFSQMAFKSTLNELLTKGDDLSLLKAIRIDKTSLYSNPIKMRLMKAQLSGDSEFLNKLGNAIKATPLQKEDVNNETYIVLRLFWPMGLYKLKHEELYYFLKDDCGLIPPSYPANFEKFLQRHIKPLFD